MSRDIDVGGQEPHGDEVSVFDLASGLLRNRWRIVRWMVLGGAVAVAPVIFQGLKYTATASFVPQGAADRAAGLVGIAGTLAGNLLASGSALSESPQFYQDLLGSRVILAPIAADTFNVPEEEGLGRRALVELLEIDEPTEARRVETAVRELNGSIVSSSIVQETGVVRISVSSPWPSLSLNIAERLVSALNAFNLETRQSQATQEREFTAGRLLEARAVLRAAEDTLQAFLQANRQFQNAPELLFAHDRLQREVALQQQIVTSLAESYETVRIREARDIPVITVIEQPQVRPRADPRGRLRRGILGLILGALAGMVAALTSDMVRRLREAEDPAAETFFRLLGEVKAELLRFVPGLG